MKKLCRSRGAVHPSPPTISDHLVFLPACLLALTASLSPVDLEVLAYLVSANNTDCTATVPPSKKGSRKNPSSAAKSGGKGHVAGWCSVFGGGGGKGGDDGDHDPNFCCDCFRCYTSYWVRWDKSPNRQLIDEIIDTYEAGLSRDGCSRNNSRGGRGRKERRKARVLEEEAGAAESSAGVGGVEQGSRDKEIRESESDQEEGRDEADGGGGDGADNGSVRRLVSFIGERIWGAWN